jgi:hypothetical protein
MSGSQEKADLLGVEGGETAEVFKNLCQTLEQAIKKMECQEKRVDFQGEKSSDVLKGMLQWFQESDFQQGGSNQIVEEICGLLEVFSNSLES